jgi:hypothetical protein
MITPHNLNIRLKRFKHIIGEYYPGVVEQIEKTCNEEFDSTYFTKENTEIIIDKLEYAVLCIYIGIPETAIECLKDIRTILDDIFVKNLLLVNRLFKDNDDGDIGTLDFLPDLVKFEIHKLVYVTL